jgi:hypothetical protein
MSQDHSDKHERNRSALMGNLAELGKQMRVQIEAVSAEHHEKHDAKDTQLRADLQRMSEVGDLERRKNDGVFRVLWSRLQGSDG